MKIDIHVDDEELKQMIMNRVADKVIGYIMGDWDKIEWDKKDAHKEKKVNEILSQVDWKKAGPELNQIVMTKFFNTLIDNKKN